jgi:ribose/xylose/arabinose/galactoside ABC-type transport system permease subunit
MPIVVLSLFVVPEMFLMRKTGFRHLFFATGAHRVFARMSGVESGHKIIVMKKRPARAQAT